MEQRVHAAHKDGFRTSKILKYTSQNLDFPLEMGSLLLTTGKFVEFNIATLDLYC